MRASASLFAADGAAGTGVGGCGGASAGAGTGGGAGSGTGAGSAGVGGLARAIASGGVVAPQLLLLSLAPSSPLLPL